MSGSILLIDDNPDLLKALRIELESVMKPGEAEIRAWIPKKEEADPLAVFTSKIDSDTELVITDYDLTAQGRTGLFGSIIVSWCQAKAIPVGDFSRNSASILPREPNLFELRVPGDKQKAGAFIVNVARGFRVIRERLKATSALMKKRSPAAVLAELLGVPDLSSQFSLYGARPGATGTLLDRILRTAPEEVDPTDDDKRQLLVYLLGHVLLNSILKFPGPIVSRRALAAYVGCSDSEGDELDKLFANAVYSGPFSELDRYFWLSKVDETLQKYEEALPKEVEPETYGELHRTALEKKISRLLARHPCNRCDGKNGGFLCPFTNRTVCQRADCSVGSSGWLPQGARLCRIERDFYEEWAPILGM
jgi:hypothetical protein